MQLRRSATDAQPEGTVTTFVQTTGSKIAFDVNSTAEGIERVPEIPKAFYDPRTGALTTLKGSIYLTVQSVFIGAELPIRMVDRKAETITLMKIARKPV